MLLFLLLLTCVLAYFMQKLSRRKFKKVYDRYKTSRRSLPLVGHGLTFLWTTGEEYMNIIKDIGQESYNNGGMITFWLGSKLYLGVTKPEIAEEILKKCSDKDDIITLFHLLSGNGSVFAPVAIWRRRRKTLAPMFTMKNLNEFVKTFDEQSNIMIKCMKEIRSETFSISEYFTRYSLDAICENTLGVKVQTQIHPTHEFLEAIHQVFALTVERMLRPWLHLDSIYKTLPVYKKFAKFRDTVHNFVNEVIQSKNLTMQQNTKEKGFKSFLTDLMQSAETNEHLSDIGLMEEAVVIILAGTDTTAVGASFTSLMLARHPEVQERCYQEVVEVFGDSDRPVTAADLLRLKYLEAVIKETLRLYPPAPVITRKLEKGVNLSSGDTLAKGCGIFLFIYGIHRNPAYWGADADQFRPERFLHSELKHPAAFMPFSYGPRNCLGYQYAMLSLKTVLARLLRQYRLVPAGAGAPAAIRLQGDLMLRDVDNFTVKIQPRQMHN